MKRDKGREPYEPEAPVVGGEDVDRSLTGPEQEHLRKLVRALPDEPVSMLWRSTLNDRLRLEAGKFRRRKRLAWLWKPAFGLGLAGCVAAAVFFQGNVRTQPAPNKGLESAIMSAHMDDVAAGDIAEDGLSPVDAEDDNGVEDSANRS